MRIIFEKGTFWAVATFAEKDIPKSADFRWNPAKKQWYTTDPSIAKKLIGYADEEAAAAIASLQEKKAEAIEASRAVDANIEIPAPTGLTYLPFQKAGIAYTTSRHSTLIADEMGLGKTIQAIGTINADPGIKKILVICPASLRLNWKRELEKWLVRPLSISIANGAIEPSDILIINYDILKKHDEHIKNQTWDLLVCDESHFLKNPKALRTQQVLGGKEIQGIKAGKKIFLTGTPIVNRPIELWPLVHALDPNGLGASWFTYVTRYCSGRKTRWGWEVGGASNLDELQEKLRSSIMVRRLKKDVLTELPAKRRQIIELPANGCLSAVKAENAAFEKHEKTMELFKIRAELAKSSDNPAEYKAAVEALKDAGRVAFTEISKLRHQTAIAKIPLVIEHITETLESVEKIVVFAHHHDVIDGIASALTESKISHVIFTGETSMSDRQSAVDSFQSDPDCKVFIGSITAAGVGITLTASSYEIFCESSWVPGDISQAEDRCHRIGQAESVLIQHLVLNGSLDVRMTKTIIEKQEIIEQALDTKTEKSDDNESETIIPVSEKLEPTTKKISREKIAKEAETLTQEQVEKIHEGLQIIAESCDYAQQKDRQGFNRIDAGIGHQLADLNRLTPKQAALGLHLLKKYKKQLPEEFLSI